MKKLSFLNMEQLSGQVSALIFTPLKQLNALNLGFLVILLSFGLMSCEHDEGSNIQLEVGNQLLLGKWKLTGATNFSNQNAILSSKLTLNENTYSKESPDGSISSGLWKNHNNTNIELSSGLFNDNVNFKVMRINSTSLVLEERAEGVSQFVEYQFERMH